MRFTASEVDRLRVRFAEYRELHRTRPTEPLAIDLVLAEMKGNSGVPPSFFEGRTLKTLNNTLQRFVHGTRSEDATLEILTRFLDENDVERHAEIDTDNEAEVVHGLMANGSLEARRVFEAIDDGRYVSKWLSDSDKRIELHFECDRQRMLIEVEEHCYLDEFFGDRRKGGKAVRKGYGFLATGQFLLHIFLVGAHARDRVHYVESPAFNSMGHPRLVRFGSDDAAHGRGEPGTAFESKLWGVHHFQNAALKAREKAIQEEEEQGPRKPWKDLMTFAGPPRDVAWGVLPNGLRNDPHAAEKEFIDAVRINDLQNVGRLLKKGVDVNYQDDLGMTSLHHAAALGTRHSLRLLLESKRCNFLIKDNLDRYPSELAIEWSRDFAVARLLARKRLMQAHKEGLPARSASMSRS